MASRKQKREFRKKAKRVAFCLLAFVLAGEAAIHQLKKQYERENFTYFYALKGEY